MEEVGHVSAEDDEDALMVMWSKVWRRVVMVMELCRGTSDDF